MNKKTTLNCSFGTYQKENMRYFMLQTKNNLSYINSGGSIFCAISFYFYFKIFLFQNSCFKISISKLLFQHFSFKISFKKFSFSKNRNFEREKLKKKNKKKIAKNLTLLNLCNLNYSLFVA